MKGVPCIHQWVRAHKLHNATMLTQADLLELRQTLNKLSGAHGADVTQANRSKQKINTDGRATPLHHY